MRIDQLSVETRIALSRVWLEPGEMANILELDPALVSTRDKLEQNLGDLLASQAADGRDAALAQLSAEGIVVDSRHDAKRRGVRRQLLAVVDLAEPDAAVSAQEAQALLVELKLDDLSINQASYVDEAGAAEGLEHRLNDALRLRLRAIPSPNGTLEQEVDAIVQAGARLGAIEAERLRLLQAQAKATSISSLDAKRRWVALVRTLETNLKVAALTDAQRTTVLASLHRELARP